jgi:hypothetical protein
VKMKFRRQHFLSYSRHLIHLQNEVQRILRLQHWLKLNKIQR